MALDLDTLNPEQRSAVETIHGPLLVLAGAGTGKTRVITYRMAYLMINGVKPENILAMTFTNKAAREMKERLSHLAKSLDGIDPFEVKKKVVAGTFHSFCVRVLRSEIEALGYKNNFSILDEEDQSGILKKIITRLVGKNEKCDPKLASSLISLAKNKGIPIQKITKDDLIWEISKRYQEAIKLQNAVDFDDLLVLALELLKTKPEVRDRLRAKHRYLLVDEYQDTNKLQFEIVRNLVSDKHDVCAVGDDDQSIYGWRGAEAGNILEFEHYFPNPKIIKLECNYRSTPIILKAANNVIMNNARRRAKALWSKKPEGEKIRVVAAATDIEEAEWVTEDIARLCNTEGKKWDDFAILYRMNAQSRVFEQHLRKCRISYRIIGGMSFYERREVKDALAYLQVMLNPHDDASLLRIINSPPRGIGATLLESVIEESRQHETPVWDEILKRASRNSERGDGNLKAFVELVEKYAARFKEPGKHMTGVQDLLQEINFFKDLEKSCKEPQEFLNRSENVRELVNALDEFENKNEGSMQEFLDSMMLDRDKEDDDEISGTGVTLMTLHSAKGLEFPIVYLVGVEDGLMPHERTKLEGHVDEERRLMYVGITRAMERLSISYCMARRKYGQDEFRNPSPFIEELPKEVIHRFFASEGQKTATTSSALSRLQALKAKLATE